MFQQRVFKKIRNFLNIRRKLSKENFAKIIAQFRDDFEEILENFRKFHANFEPLARFFWGGDLKTEVFWRK